MTYADDIRKWDARRRAIVEHYRQSGSLRETGLAFGISGQRVSQIVLRMEGKDGEDHAGGSDTAPAVGAGRDG